MRVGPSDGIGGFTQRKRERAGCPLSPTGGHSEKPPSTRQEDASHETLNDLEP